MLGGHPMSVTLWNHTKLGHKVSDLLDVDSEIGKGLTQEKGCILVTAGVGLSDSRRTGIPYWNNLRDRLTGKTIQNANCCQNVFWIRSWRDTGNLSWSEAVNLLQVAASQADQNSYIWLNSGYIHEYSWVMWSTTKRWKNWPRIYPECFKSNNSITRLKYNTCSQFGEKVRLLVRQVEVRTRVGIPWRVSAG